MQPSSEQPITRPPHDPDVLDTQTSRRLYAPSSAQQIATPPDQQPFYTLHTRVVTQQLPTSVTTQQLSAPTTIKLQILGTAHLPTSGPFTTTKLPTVIPAPQKRTRSTAVARVPRRRRAVVISSIVASLAIVLFVSVFVAPLDNGQHEQGIVQALGNIISAHTFGSIDPAQHIVPPTSLPAATPTLTNKGYCGGTDIWGTCATATTANGVMGTGTMQSPISGAIITQVFAHPEYQAWCGCWKPHTGIDLAADYGTPIMAADSGQVIWVGWDWSGLGWSVKINHGNYIATIYGHMAAYLVKVGDSVTKGQVIGREGSTGASTGPHLHFMVLVNNIWVNPTNYVALP